MSKIRVRNGVREKLCSACKIWKPLTDFSPGGESHQRAPEVVCIAGAATATLRVIGLGGELHNSFSIDGHRRVPGVYLSWPN